MISTHYALRASLIASGIYITDVIGEIKKKKSSSFFPTNYYIHSLLSSDVCCPLIYCTVRETIFHFILNHEKIQGINYGSKIERFFPGIKNVPYHYYLVLPFVQYSSNLETDSQNLRICYTACWGWIWILWIKNQKSEIREIRLLKMLKILFFKFLKTLFFWFFTFSSAPASACCIAYSQILGIRLFSPF